MGSASRLGIAVGMLVLGCGRWSYGQIVGVSGGAASTQSGSAVSRTVKGRVVNSVDGAAVARALVQINSRAVLTDSQGHFEFAAFTDPQAFVTVTRPGFSQSTDQMGYRPLRIADLDAPVEVKLYPDAIVTGVVTGRDGQPLSGVQVQLRRLVYSANVLRAQTAGGMQTNSRGEFRFRQPAGRYQLGIVFNAKNRDSGEAVIPETYPAHTGSSTPSFFTTEAGQELRIDLRPKTGLTYPVPVHVEPADLQRGVQFSATTTSGETFFLPGGPGGGGGVFQLSLPAGSYVVHGRVDNRETVLEGTTRVSVTSKPPDAAAMLRLVPATSLPVELTVDPASATTTSQIARGKSQSLTTSQQTVLQPPDARSFNLHLHNVDWSAPIQDIDMQLRQREDKTYEFLVPPGSYRLEANLGGQWYVEAATCGVTDLTTSEIKVAAGAAGSPIRLTINNVMGMVRGTVTHQDGVDSAWVYLVPRNHSLMALNPIFTFSAGNSNAPIWGTRVPVGSYTAVATDHQVQEDLQDAAVLARFSSNAKQVDVTETGTASVDLAISVEKVAAK